MLRHGRATWRSGEQFAGEWPPDRTVPGATREDSSDVTARSHHGSGHFCGMPTHPSGDLGPHAGKREVASGRRVHVHTFGIERQRHL
jgi:hypothetical protein